MSNADPTGPRVAIVMATYNGAAYLHEQLASIQGQTVDSWDLLVRDDASTDSTMEILEEAAAADDRIRIVRDNLGNLGHVGNFAQLLQHSRKHDWVLCADQDDVWESRKVELLLREAAKLDASRPQLVFHDFSLIDSGGRVARPHGLVVDFVRSLAAYDVASLLGFDYVWGCTTIANRALLDLALPIPLDAENHDYWLALVAAATDGLSYLDLPLVRYRKHDANVTGDLQLASWGSRLTRLVGSGLDASISALARKDRQAAYLAARIGASPYVSPATRATVDSYVASLETSSWKRLRATRAAGVRFRGRSRFLMHCVILVASRRRGRRSAFEPH